MMWKVSAVLAPGRGTRPRPSGLVALGLGRVDHRALDGHEQVADLAAGPADQVVVGRFHVGVEAHGAGAKIEGGDLPHLGELVERLVDRFQRDGGHLGAHHVVDHFRRRMALVAFGAAEDALALRGDLSTAGPEPVRELVDGTHAAGVYARSPSIVI